MNHGLIFLNHDTSYIQSTAKALSAGVPLKREKPVQHLLGEVEARKVTKWLILYRPPKVWKHYPIPESPPWLARPEIPSDIDPEKEGKLVRWFEELSKSELKSRIKMLGERLCNLLDGDWGDAVTMKASGRVLSIPRALLSPDNNLFISNKLYSYEWLKEMSEIGAIRFYG